MADQQNTGKTQETPKEQSGMGAGGVPKGGCFLPGNPIFSCTEDVPAVPPPEPKMDEWFEGYESKPVHPMYRTSSSNYGAKPPTVHTMPTSFHCKSQKFSENLGKCGMYRNHSLNTNLDQSNV